MPTQGTGTFSHCVMEIVVFRPTLRRYLCYRTATIHAGCRSRVVSTKQLAQSINVTVVWYNYTHKEMTETERYDRERKRDRQREK